MSGSLSTVHCICTRGRKWGVERLSCYIYYIYSTPATASLCLHPVPCAAVRGVTSLATTTLDYECLTLATFYYVWSRQGQWITYLELIIYKYPIQLRYKLIYLEQLRIALITRKGWEMQRPSSPSTSCCCLPSLDNGWLGVGRVGRVGRVGTLLQHDTFTDKVPGRVEWQ